MKHSFCKPSYRFKFEPWMLKSDRLHGDVGLVRLILTTLIAINLHSRRMGYTLLQNSSLIDLVIITSSGRVLV